MEGCSPARPHPHPGPALPQPCTCWGETTGSSVEGRHRGTLGSRVRLQSRATWRAEGLLFRADLAGQVAGIGMATPSVHRPPPGGMKQASQVDRHLFSGRGQCVWLRLERFCTVRVCE